MKRIYLFILVFLVAIALIYLFVFSSVFEEKKKDCEGNFFWSKIEKECVSRGSNIFISKIHEKHDGEVSMTFGEVVIKYEIDNSLLRGFSKGDVVEAKFLERNSSAGGEIVDIVRRKDLMNS